MTARTIALCLALSSLISCADRAALSSPDGKLTLNVYTTAEGELGFDLIKDGTPLLPDSRLGLETDLRSWNGSLEIAGISDEERIVESYAMPTGKRRLCSNEFSRKTYTVLNADGDSLLIEFMLADDGAAFRYIVPNALPGERVTGESSAYRIPDGTRRWIQTYERDGYEAFYPLTTDGAPRGKWRPASLWGYPALVEPCEDVFVLLSEADIRRAHCGSYLDNGEDRTLYRVVPADSCATTAGSSWESPWRVMIAGSLAQVVESTLITDLSPECVLKDTGWIRPGIAAWIYWAHNHGSQDYRLVTQYIDLAAEMGWPYDLIDAEWDRMRGGDIEDALAYARQKGVRPIVWYNSSTNWINGAPTPYYRLNDPEDRRREFQWLRDNGAAGVKVDFFRGDKVEDMDYYLDILEDAADYSLTVNFHGATLPRGWQRTYPHMVSVEAVYGAEWYNNTPLLTTEAARHNATLPFTRNVVGPMDYTPGTFSDSQHPHITTDCHELALTILFESGIQHMPDRPETYRSLPEKVRSLLSTLPSAWDDTRLLAGYPGEYAVIARQKGGKWYVAGINGSDESRSISLSLARLGTFGRAELYLDTESGKGFDISGTDIGSSDHAAATMELELLPRGGFVMVIG